MAIVSDRVLERLKKSFCESASESESEDSDTSDTSDNASVNSLDTTSSVGEYPSLMSDPLPPNADFGVTLKKGEVNCKDGTRLTSRHSQSKNPTSSKHRSKRDHVLSKKKPNRKKQKISGKTSGCIVFDFDSTSDASTSDKGKKNKDNSNQLLLATLQDVTKTLNKLVDRVEGTEKDLKYVKRKLLNSSSSSSDNPASKRSKIDVPRFIRTETQKVYKMLIDDDEQFTGFKVGSGVHFSDSVNQHLVTRLIKEVQSINPSFQSCQIRDAAKTYYRTLSQKEFLDRRGKASPRKKERRHRERLQRINPYWRYPSV